MVSRLGKWIKPVVIGLAVLGLLFSNGIPAPIGAGVPPAGAVTPPWYAGQYGFDSAQTQGWRVHADVRFEWKYIPGIPSVRNVTIDCSVPWSLFYRIEILQCSPNLGGEPTTVKMNGEWYTLYRPGFKYRACFGIKDFGELCGAFATYRPVQNGINDYGYYHVWAPITVSL